MKQIIKFTVILSLLFAAGNIHAQNVEKIQESLTAARDAFDSGNYRTAIEKVAEVERMAGVTNMPATAYIKIMSYYRLKEYENCVSAADAYLNGGKAVQDETLTQIRNARQNAQTILARREAERQQQLAAQQAELQRKEEAARTKAAHEKEAAQEWKIIEDSEDLTELSEFIRKYGDTPSKAAAQVRYDDEKAWQDAKKVHSIDSYEAYLKMSGAFRHRQEARDILEAAYPQWLERYKTEGEVSQMVDMYNRYISMFPQGGKAQSMKQSIAQRYFAIGQERAASKDIGTLRSAIDTFEDAQRYNYQPQSSVTELIRKTEKRLNRQQIRQSSYSWLAPTFDARNCFGLGQTHEI
jgi:hypothetical protein